MSDKDTILVVNPGSTSTKVGAFSRDGERFAETIRHEAFSKSWEGPLMDQIPIRVTAIDEALRSQGVADTAFLAVAGRGGLLKPLVGGTYRVNDLMLADLRAARLGQHASNLGAFLAQEFANRGRGAGAFIVDPVSVDEWEPVARLSGLKGLDRVCLSHALNSRAVARRVAAQMGRDYGDLRLIVVHLGSGTSVSVHVNGRMVDVNNSMEEGPFSMDRAGGVPTMRLLDMVMSSPDIAMKRRLFGDGGVFSYLGTRDFREVLSRVAAGEDHARLVLDAMAYQVAKEIGAMATVLAGRCDGVVLTGGMAHEPALVNRIRDRVAFIAPMIVMPGEDELKALADGVFRVLDGDEIERTYT